MVCLLVHRGHEYPNHNQPQGQRKDLLPHLCYEVVEPGEPVQLPSARPFQPGGQCPQCRTDSASIKGAVQATGQASSRSGLGGPGCGKSSTQHRTHDDWVDGVMGSMYGWKGRLCCIAGAALPSPPPLAERSTQHMTKGRSSQGHMARYHLLPCLHNCPPATSVSPTHPYTPAHTPVVLVPRPKHQPQQQQEGQAHQLQHTPHQPPGTRPEGSHQRHQQPLQ